MFKYLNEFFDDYLTSQPDKNCCWFEGSWLKRSEIFNLAEQTTQILKRSGFSKGQRLVALMPNSPANLALMLSVWRLGGIFCPLNEKTGEISLLRTLDLLKPFAVVVSESVKKDLVDALKNSGWDCSICKRDSHLEDFSGKIQPVTPEDENLAVIFSTSGTTGNPKAVPLTHANIIDNCYACWDRLDILNTENVFLNVLPGFHAFGFTVCTVLPFVVGATQVLIANFMPPSKTLAALIESGADTLLLVPTMVGFVTSMLERQNKKLQNIKILITGGDRYNIKMDDRVKNAFGVPVVEGYGITECSPVLSVNKNAEIRKLGTVGPALKGFEIQLRSENDEILENASEGVLWVKGASVTPGYYHAPEVNQERFKDGFFNTGDYVQIDSEGYIKILDRVTDIIIVGGFNVYPQEVEAILSENPAVQSAVVVGTPNDMSGEVPKAFIVRNPDVKITENELIKFCKERLAHYKVPRVIEFIDSLPLSATGKVLRRVLRQREREKI